MGRALKYSIVVPGVIAALCVAVVYGLYALGAHDIASDWKPTRTIHSARARMALWRSLQGEGQPKAEQLSPLTFAWRLVGMVDEASDGGLPRVTPGQALAHRVARSARLRAPHGMVRYHLMQAAATIQASRWPVEQQLDTVLANTYFAPDVRGLHAGSLNVFGVPASRLDPARLHLLIALARAPRYLDPWCHPDRLRERIARPSSGIEPVLTSKQIDDALRAIRPAPPGHVCG
jgi:hypothetical protein